MRLLHRDTTGGLCLTEDLQAKPPRYAILSHRWGPEEVTLQELMDGTGLAKRGYHKLRFCGEQAQRDGLSYFWVDTCCIDKKNAVELQEAINSMFRWYSKATKCYVYLDDVSCPTQQPAESLGASSQTTGKHVDIAGSYLVKPTEVPLSLESLNIINSVYIARYSHILNRSIRPLAKLTYTP
jgi:hypothetical protein